MNDEVREWLETKHAHALWDKELSNGSISMFHVGQKTFMLRFYKCPTTEEHQGWEVFINLDPMDALTTQETLVKLTEYCAEGCGSGGLKP